MASPSSVALPSPLLPEEPSRFYLPGLDALRFGAFFLVFLHHALPHSSADLSWLPVPWASAVAAIARAGAWGVDLFFALSSYLITSLLTRELQNQGMLDIRAFYTRRALRIWPLYVVALLVLAPAISTLIPGEAMPPSYTAAYFLLSGNWACALWGFPPSSFASLWSVSIEEQFYLVWPWIARKLPRRLPHLAVGALIIANAARLALVILGVQHPGIWCNTFARLDAIAMGVLLASMPPHRLRFSPASRAWLAFGALLTFLALGAWGDYSGTRALLSYPIASLASVTLVAVSLGSSFQAPVLNYLGKISYGLYVFHEAALRVVAATGIGGTLTALAVTVLVASASYRHLEAPFLRRKERFARVRSRPSIDS